MSATPSVAVILALSSLAAVAPATSAETLHVKIVPGSDPTELSSLGAATPLFTLPQKQLKKLSRAQENLPDLELWYSVAVDDIDAVNLEETHPIVSDVVVPQSYESPSEVDRALSTADLTSGQGYLLPNDDDNNGIDAAYSWTVDGGDGSGVTIYDVEYAWDQGHEDLAAASDVAPLLNDGDFGSNPLGNDAVSHGTSVLGAAVASDNGFGVKGVSHGAFVGLAPERTAKLGSARANAILLAVADGKPGDVILLEMQAPSCGLGGTNYGPAEDDLDVYEATKVAVGNGFVVVATAGNGNVNLDGDACYEKYDRRERDSGAIIVGAGGAGGSCSPARERLDFSTYGYRVDVQGWGECIATTSSPSYTESFGGTSGAAAMVAAAAANLQGVAVAKFGAPRDPLVIRKLLTDTGVAQSGNDREHIGPLVNLRAAVDALVAQPTVIPPPDRLPEDRKGGYHTVQSSIDKDDLLSSSSRSPEYDDDIEYSSTYSRISTKSSKSSKSSKGSKRGKSNKSSDGSGGGPYESCEDIERRKECIKSYDCKWDEDGNGGEGRCEDYDDRDSDDTTDEERCREAENRRQCRNLSGCEWNANRERCQLDVSSDGSSSSSTRDGRAICPGLQKKACKKAGSCKWRGNECADGASLAKATGFGAEGVVWTQRQSSGAWAVGGTGVPAMAGYLLVAVWYL